MPRFSKVISITLDPELLEIVHERCKYNHMLRSEYIRAAIRYYILHDQEVTH